jgi:hypothetical protein
LQVDESTTVPLFACLITALIGSGLTCINLGSPTAFNDVVSVAIAGLYGSYLVACSMLLWRRSTGAISKHDPKAKDTINTVGFRLVWGPFHLKGILGVAINLFACTYLLAAFFFVFWPISLPVRVDNMNYSSAMFGGVIFLSALYYLVWGHHDYFGPVVETSTGVSRHDQHPSLYRNTQSSIPIPRTETRSSVRTAETAETAGTAGTAGTTETVETAGSVRPPTAEYELSVSYAERALSRNASDIQVMGPLEVIGAPRRTASGSIKRQPSNLSRTPTMTDSIRFMSELGGTGRNSYESLGGSVEEIPRPDGAIHPLRPRAHTSGVSGRRTATPTIGYRGLERYGSGYGHGHARTMSLNSNSNRSASLTSKHGSFTNASLQKRSLHPDSQRPSAIVHPWVEGRWENERWEATEWREGDHTRVSNNWSERFGRDGIENRARVREESRAREGSRVREGREADGRNSYRRDARQQRKGKERDPSADAGPSDMAFDEGALAYMRRGMEENQEKD